MPEELKPDDDALKEWDKLPKNNPGKGALPPATGGVPNWLWAFIVLAVVLTIFALVQGMIGA